MPEPLTLTPEAEEAARALRDRAAYLKGYTYNSTMVPALLRMAEQIDMQVKNAER